jgi:Fe-S-cluster containining protein
LSRPPEPELPPDLVGKRELAEGDSFAFACHSGLPCFTRCCADINIVLTPVDVLRLSRRLGITTGDFLHRYALIPVSKQLQLPVVMLRMGEDPDRRCQLVGDQGCTVYEDRPWSCRMYPVAMALPPARAGVEPQPRYFLCEDDFCEGRVEGRGWTVAEWRKDQGVAEREELEAGFREIVSHPWFIGGRQLDPKRMEMLFTACYDLDKFRSFVFDSTFLKRFELEQALVEQLKSDDDTLLRFAFRWLRFALFGEPVLTVRPDSRRSA